MAGDFDQYIDAFKEEAEELLSDLEESLLELEENPGNEERIGGVFRVMHTLKGAGGMFGLEEITKVTHGAETAYDKVRNGELTVTKEMIDLTLQVCDLVRIILNYEDYQGNEHSEQISEILEKFANLSVNSDAGETVDEPSPKDEPEESLEPIESTEPQLAEVPSKVALPTFLITYQLSKELIEGGTDPKELISELEKLGTCIISSKTDQLGDIDGFLPEYCYGKWDLILQTDKKLDDIKSVFIFVESECGLSIEKVPETSDVAPPKKEIQSAKEPEKESQVKIPEKEKELTVPAPPVIEVKKSEPPKIPKKEKSTPKKNKKEDSAMSSIRVPSIKLDHLVDLVSELVTVQAHLSQTADSKNDPELLLIAEEVERLISELRDNAMNIRMLTIGTLFGKFKRLVRDLASDLGKKITMKTEGEETELDKTVIECLNDPLIHLIRNCIDHGIESPEKRSAAGKSEEGNILIKASQAGSSVLIHIIDDGAGLDPNAIKAKARERGVLGLTEEIPEKDLFNLILAPGFSTAQKVSNVSGRGVGMDVVKRNIESLRGSLDISSKFGEGTTITLKLPLTLAIIDGLLVTIGEQFFVLPLSSVEECVELTRDDVINSHGRQVANVRGDIVPYINLKDKFAVEKKDPDVEQIVITGIDDKRIGFVVDQVIGKHQTVIKTLGRVYKDVEGVSGATILGDGTVALILDVAKLISDAELEEQATF